MAAGAARGMLILVVGPSGVGKDTLIAGARERLAQDARFAFARRTITRPATPEGEDHSPVDAAEFARQRAQGAFALSWEAHGLSYGVPRALEAELATGRHVIVNVSRGIVAEAERKYPPVGVILVTASLAQLAGRLTGRGRESEEQVVERLASGWDDEAIARRAITVRNEGTIEDGIDALLDAIMSHTRNRPAKGSY